MKIGVTQYDHTFKYQICSIGNLFYEPYKLTKVARHANWYYSGTDVMGVTNYILTVTKTSSMR